MKTATIICQNPKCGGPMPEQLRGRPRKYCKKQCLWQVKNASRLLVPARDRDRMNG